MPALSIRLPSSVRHPPNSFSLSPRYHAHDSDAEQIPPYNFQVIPEEVRESSNSPFFFTLFSYYPRIRLALASPSLAPLFWRNGVHLDSPLSPHWHSVPHPWLVDTLQLPFPGCAQNRWRNLWWTRLISDQRLNAPTSGACQPRGARLCAINGEWWHHHALYYDETSIHERASIPR